MVLILFIIAAAIVVALSRNFFKKLDGISTWNDNEG